MNWPGTMLCLIAVILSVPTATKFIKLNQKEVCNCLMDNKAQKSCASNLTGLNLYRLVMFSEYESINTGQMRIHLNCSAF